MKKNILLILSIFILLLLIKIIPSTNENKPYNKTSFLSLNLKTLDSFFLNSKKKKIGIYKTKNEIITYPSSFLSSKNKLNDLLIKLTLLKCFSINTPKLGKVQFYVEIKNRNRLKKLFFFKKIEIENFSHYLKYENKFYLVKNTKELNQLIGLKESDLRSRYLFNYSSKDISTFSINNNFFYKSKNNWYLKGQKKDNTNTKTTFNTFATFSSLKIKKYITKKISINSQKKIYLSINLKNGSTRKVLLFKKSNSYFCFDKTTNSFYQIFKVDWFLAKKSLNSFIIN